MKKFFLLLTAVFLAFLLGFSGDVTAAKKKPLIGASIITYEMPWFSFMTRGMKRAAKEEGFDMIFLDGQNSPAKQMAHCEEFIAKKVDLIILNPCESDALVPGAEMVYKSKIPLITLDRQVNVPPDKYACYVGHDWVLSGFMNAIQIVQLMGGRGKLAIIEGAPGAESNISRIKAWEAVHKLYPEIEIIFDQTANWLRTDGMKVTENLLQAHKQIDCIWYVAEEMYYGGLEAIKASGRRKEFKIVTQNGSSIYNIPKGDLDAGLIAQPEYQGYVVVKTAAKVLRGEKVPKWVQIPLLMIDSTNYNCLKDKSWTYEGGALPK